MTAVAGDFYEFISVDRKRVGFLVADVTGHGVPAALIASMKWRRNLSPFVRMTHAKCCAG